MVIVKKLINREFPDSLINDICILAGEDRFSPIWQTVGWNRMLQKSRYSDKGIFI
jgi:hypothetical protein